MKAAFKVFEKGLDDLNQYIEALHLQTDAVKAILKTSPPLESLNYATLIANFSPKRRFEYNCIIITLYGLLERFSEDLLEEYLLEVNSTVDEYGKLPHSLTKAHYDLTVTHLSRANQKYYRGITSPATIVENFNSCLQNKKTYKLTTETFCHHTANFRKDIIDDFFNRVGIHSICRQAIHTKKFTDFIATLDPPRIIPKGRPETILQEIDDLAERRNEVAHGAVSDILSLEWLSEYITIVRHFGSAMHEIVEEQLASYKVEYSGILLGKPIRVYNHQIVCIQTKGYEICCGDCLAIKTNNAIRPYRLTEITSIEIESVRVQKTVQGEDIATGLRVDGRVKETYDIYLIKKMS